MPRNPPKKEKARRNPELTRAKLLEVAISEFARKGYHGVAVDDIVDKAGYNKRMVYHYFGSKQKIYQEAILHVYSRLETLETAIAAEHKDPRIRLTNLFASYFDFLQQNPEFFRILLWENLNKGMGISGNERILRKDPVLVQFRKIINEGVEAGIFRSGLDVKHLLIEFYGLCFIYFSNAYTLSQALKMDLTDPRVLKKAQTRALDLVLNGILA